MTPISIRFPTLLHESLKRYAERAGQPLSTVAQRAIDEWLRMAEHLGVVFRDGPAGRRAGLAAGPDVWEVAAVLDQQQGSPEERLKATADHLGLALRQVEVAADYWAAHRAEVDAQVRANVEAADREMTAWEQRRRLLGA